MTNVKRHFSQACECLEKLFFPHPVNFDKLSRLYDECEKAWKVNIKRLKDLNVKYLIIGEAPPWVKGRSNANYFYSGLEGSWCTSILSAFDICRGRRAPEALLDEFAKNGALVVDTLPFAMPYTSQMRMRYYYFKMVKLCRNWMEKRLQSSALSFATNPKVAFAFKLNAEAVIEMYNGELDIGQSPTRLRPSMIAAGGSGFTNATELKRVLGISVGFQKRSS